jgi:hypothetical protein
MVSLPPSAAKARGPRRCEGAAGGTARGGNSYPSVHPGRSGTMRKFSLLLIVLTLAACSAYGPNKQIPMINGVPVYGAGMGGGGVGFGK